MKDKSKDKIYWVDLFGPTWYICTEHNIPYPTGAACPKCVNESKVQVSKPSV